MASVTQLQAEAWGRTAPIVERLALKLDPEKVRFLYVDKNYTLEQIARALLPNASRSIDVSKAAVYLVLKGTLDDDLRAELELKKKSEGGQKGYAGGLAQLSKGELAEISCAGGTAAMNNRIANGELYAFQSAAGQQGAKTHWSEKGREKIAINDLIYPRRDLGVIVALYITPQEKRDNLAQPIPVKEIARLYGVSPQAIERDLEKSVDLCILSLEERMAELAYRRRYHNIQNNNKRWAKTLSASH